MTASVRRVPGALVVYADAPDQLETGNEPAEPVVSALVRPDTGEVADHRDPAETAAWYLAVLEFEDAVIRSAKAVGRDLLNRHLDAANVSKLQAEDEGARLYEITGESARAAAEAIVVADPLALRSDLDVLVARGLLTPQAADDACRVEVSETYRTSVPKLRGLASREGEVGRVVREHLVAQPRARKAPTVKRRG